MFNVQSHFCKLWFDKHIDGMLVTPWRMEHIQVRMDASDKHIVEKLIFIENFFHAS